MPLAVFWDCGYSQLQFKGGSHPLFIWLTFWSNLRCICAEDLLELCVIGQTEDANGNSVVKAADSSLLPTGFVASGGSQALWTQVASDITAHLQAAEMAV